VRWLNKGEPMPAWIFPSPEGTALEERNVRTHIGEDSRTSFIDNGRYAFARVPRTRATADSLSVHSCARAGDPHFRELEPDRCVVEAAGGAPRRGVKRLVLRPFRFGQAQEYEDGAVERLHFFGGQ
jgi:hypothetical protein